MKKNRPAQKPTSAKPKAKPARKIPKPTGAPRAAAAAAKPAARPKKAAKKSPSGRSEDAAKAWNATRASASAAEMPSAQEASRSVIILPPRSFLPSLGPALRGLAEVGGAPAMMGAAAVTEPRRRSGVGRGMMAAAAAAVTSLGSVLNERHRALQAFADHLMHGTARGIARRGAALGGVRRGALPAGMMGVASVEMEGGGAPPADAGSATVLAGLGAVVMDRADLDVAAAAASTGARVLENVFIPLEAPGVMASTQAAFPAGDAARWHLRDINVAAARARHLTGKGVRVGVLDTGIQADHPEFHGKTIPFARFDLNGKIVSRTASDAGEHGTHVSGLIAGRNAGVAPDADLAVAAVLTYQTANGGLGGYLAQILAGMNWLLTTSFDGAGEEPGVDVMNASLGGVGFNDYYYQTLATARLTTGTLLAAAVGNSGPAMNRHGSPGNYDIVLGVGAIDASRNVASFSDWGTVTQYANLAKPDLCAPGVEVWSSVPGGAYAPMQGTSMAAPVVTGVLALLLQDDPSLAMDAQGLTKAIYALVQPLTGTSNTRRGGRGRVSF